jgi:hypothetical protein
LTPSFSKSSVRFRTIKNKNNPNIFVVDLFVGRDGAVANKAEVLALSMIDFLEAGRLVFSGVLHS